MPVTPIKIKFTDQPLGFDPENNCYVRALRKHHDVVFSDAPDLVFYSVFGTDFMKYPKSVRIFLGNEPIFPNFNDCDYAIGAANMTFGKRFFRQPPLTGYGEKLFWQEFSPKEEITQEAFDRSFCNFIYSNAQNGDGARFRIEFCERLAEYKRIDCPGQVLNNMSGGIEPRYYRKNGYSAKDFNEHWATSKIAFLRKYKFTIAFENISLAGWTTEKLIHPLMAHSIPIYWGNPDVAEYFNPKAFINCADYGNDIDAVVRAVIELDNDRERYMDMLCQPPLQETFPFDWEDSLTEFLDSVVEKGPCFYPKNPMGYTTVGAQDLGELSRTGKIGLKKILETAGRGVSGWLHYKLHREKE